MPPNITQERHIFELAEPVVIVDQDRVGRAVAEGQEALEDPANAGDVRGDLLVGQKPSALVLACRIPDLGRPAAHEHDRPVPRLLEAAKKHDLDERADVQARRGRVEPDIAGDDFLIGQRIEADRIGDLVDIAAFVEQLEQ